VVRLDNAIHWINLTNHAIDWIVINYPVDRVIHLLDNRGLVSALFSIDSRRSNFLHSKIGVHVKEFCTYM